MANYMISFYELTKDKEGKLYNEKQYIIIKKETKREVDKFVDELALNLNYSNIRLERINYE